MDPIHDGKIEVSAEFLEKFLADKSKNLDPMGRLLGSYYRNLLRNNCSADVAGGAGS